MEFKVGASLWMHSQESQMQAGPKGVPNDFGKKLALPNEARSGMENKDSELGEKAPSHGKESLYKMPSKGEQLFDWGLEAGHHLSFQAGLVSANDLPEWVMAAPVAHAADSKPHATDLRMASIEVGRASEVPTQYIFSPTPQDPVAILERSDIEGVGERLQKFLTQRWPQSSFSILPRKGGLDVIVRDFYLSDVEMHALAKDIQESMRFSDSTVEQIWINGRAVWQRAHNF